MKKHRELGRAAGLKQAAMVLQAMAREATRVVGTNRIKEIAEAMEKAADEIELRWKP